MEQKDRFPGGAREAGLRLRKDSPPIYWQISENSRWRLEQ
jgi:hypothetical protein